MLENREVTKRLFPDLLSANRVRMVGNYPLLLHQNLLSLATRQIAHPVVVLMTPGVFNSAYYEHTFLARSMGIPLVEGRDLVVDNHKVYMKTTQGLRQVDVIYRRIDDEFLDPLVFKPDSILGVPGLMSAYRKGNVVLVNAVGNGVADDKAVYAYVPDMIRYYLNEEPIISNVPTYQLSDPDAFRHVFDNIGSMVVKKTDQSGGYGMLKTGGGRSAEFHRAADHQTLDRPLFPRRALAAAACRSAALRPLRTGWYPHRTRRAYPRGIARRLTGGQFLTGRRQQGYLDRGRLTHPSTLNGHTCFHALQTHFTGWTATWSGQIISS